MSDKDEIKRLERENERLEAANADLAAQNKALADKANEATAAVRKFRADNKKLSDDIDTLEKKIQSITARQALPTTPHKPSP